MDGVDRGTVAFLLRRLVFDQLLLLIFDSLNNCLEGECRIVRILITRNMPILTDKRFSSTYTCQSDVFKCQIDVLRVRYVGDIPDRVLCLVPKARDLAIGRQSSSMHLGFSEFTPRHFSAYSSSGTTMFFRSIMNCPMVRSACTLNGSCSLLFRCSNRMPRI